MPRVRLTYHRDIAREGTDVIDTTEQRAAVLVNQRRGVILETADELAGMAKADLQDRAVRLGIEFSSSDTKADLVAAIRAAESE